MRFIYQRGKNKKIFLETNNYYHAVHFYIKFVYSKLKIDIHLGVYLLILTATNYIANVQYIV